MNATAFIRRSRMSMYPYEEARWIGVLPSDDCKRKVANQSAHAVNIHSNTLIDHELDVQYILMVYRPKIVLALCLGPYPEAQCHAQRDFYFTLTLCGKSLFTLFASLTYAYHYLMTLIK